MRNGNFGNGDPRGNGGSRPGRPVDLSVECGGIHSPNPFWLASGPPTNTAGQVMRAFDMGWGGAVWKTLGDPITNTASRYGAIDYQDRNVAGFNNIELITDRPLDVHLMIERPERHLAAFAELGYPLLVAASRKRFLGELLAEPDGVLRDPLHREAATLAVTALAATAGAWAIRVHEVPDNADAVRVAERWRRG